MYQFIEKDSASLSQLERKQITDFLIEQFADSPGYSDVVYTNPDLVTTLVIKDGTQVVGHAGITKRTIKIEGKKYLVGGVGDIAIKSTYRKTGLGNQLMLKVNELLRKDGYDLGLLFCHPDLDHFYAKSGWKVKTKGTIYAIVDGVKVDQQRTNFLPINLSNDEMNIWNSEDIVVGVGSW